MSELQAQATLPSEPAPGPSAAATYRRLRFLGLSSREAANLTGHLHGLPPVPAGWSIEEVERLLFVGELARLGRIGS